MLFAYDIWGWCCWKPLARSPGSLKFVLSSPTKLLCDFNPVILSCFMVSCGTTHKKGGGCSHVHSSVTTAVLVSRKPVKTSPRRENVGLFAFDCSLVFQSYRDPGQQQIRWASPEFQYDAFALPSSSGCYWTALGQSLSSFITSQAVPFSLHNLFLYSPVPKGRRHFAT